MIYCRNYNNNKIIVNNQVNIIVQDYVNRPKKKVRIE